MATNQKIISPTDSLLTELNKRVGVMISLLLRMAPKKSDINLQDQVKILNGFGLRPRDIASILGRTQGHINKELAGIRNRKRNKPEVVNS